MVDQNQAQQLSQQVEASVRTLIGDLQMQIIVLRSMLEMAQQPQSPAPKPKENPHPTPTDPVTQPRPVPQPPAQPETEPPLDRPEHRANGADRFGIVQ